eukprot:TRINITY_DN9834_c0_g1_i1.p2 TRINITY_DN9834_c0_g1~~TRINITY_DN9834_c0_g1_i1.p2  ORF type:complete len:184 (-),score=34.66 TRINITY_DN9834_c0_g1_i1:35-586(-)
MGNKKSKKRQTVVDLTTSPETTTKKKANTKASRKSQPIPQSASQPEAAPLPSHLQTQPAASPPPPAPAEESSSEAVYVQEQYEEAKLAIENNNYGLFDKALKGGLKVNMQDPEDGNTLLHWCACYNRLDFAKQLKEKGAKEIFNAKGIAPVEIAIDIYNQGDSSYYEIRNFLGQTTKKQLGLT